MARYKITTLIDITRTNPSRAETDVLKIAQQANFNSLIQAIGLRANPTWLSDPKKIEGRLPEPFDGKGAYWVWEFESEREDVFLKDNNPVELLIDDLHGVPVIAGLTNSVNIDPAVFTTIGKDINIHISLM